MLPAHISHKPARITLYLPKYTSASQPTNGQQSKNNTTATASDAPVDLTSGSPSMVSLIVFKKDPLTRQLQINTNTAPFDPTFLGWINTSLSASVSVYYSLFIKRTTCGFDHNRKGKSGGGVSVVVFTANVPGSIDLTQRRCVNVTCKSRIVTSNKYITLFHLEEDSYHSCVTFLRVFNYRVL